ncbi:MAG: septal ring lytic transglycosylase RlpA family protein [Chitinophagales bacterium]|nr:septal ring lytic transglycosylase RlpA family protein [Chitinophagales bacterium]
MLCIPMQNQDLFAQTGKTEIGVASYYHNKFVGRKTATGEIFVQDKMTAAHKTLPLNSWVKVTNLKNDSSVILRINDRMPQSNKRSIDLTLAAAKKLDYIHSGLTKVKIEVIPDPTKNEIPPKADKRKNLVTTQLHSISGLISYPEAEVQPKYPLVRYYPIPVIKESFFSKLMTSLKK